jgi:predicted ATPase
VIVAVADTLDRYRFAHALMRETLYTGLPQSARVRLHRQVGEALERLTAATPDPPLAELAYHFVQAAVGGGADRAVDYARRAAEQALAISAYEEAVRHYELALRVLDVQAPQDAEAQRAQRCALLLALA